MWKTPVAHGIGVDDPVLWYEGATLTARRSIFRDHQGSIVAVADATGNKIAINSYDPWGIPGATNLGRFQYTGQAWVPELGMYYYKARIYSPTLGRFLQTDPVGYEDNVNLYAYVGNDPVNGADPTGTTCDTGSRLDGGGSAAGCKHLDGFAPSEKGGSSPRSSSTNGNSGRGGNSPGIGHNGGPPLGEKAEEGLVRKIFGAVARRLAAPIAFVWSSPAAEAVRAPEFLDKVLSDPTALTGLNPTQAAELLGNNTNWRAGPLGKGSHKGQGWKYYHWNPRANEATGPQIRWHPGGGRHGPGPYWRVNNGNGQSGRIPAGEW